MKGKILETAIHNYCYLLFCIALFSALKQTWADSWMSHSILNEWLYHMVHIFNIHWSGVLDSGVWLLHGWCHMKLLPSRHKFCVTMHQFTGSLYSKPHRYKVYVYSAVTCHLHFWQNDWDLLGATAVTRRWNGYRNKSQHRKLTLEKKILPPLQQGFEPTTFQSRVWCSNHWAIPALSEWTELRLCLLLLRSFHSAVQLPELCVFLGNHLQHATVPNTTKPANKRVN